MCGRLGEEALPHGKRREPGLGVRTPASLAPALPASTGSVPLGALPVRERRGWTPCGMVVEARASES